MLKCVYFLGKVLFIRKCVLPLQRVPIGTSGQRYEKDRYKSRNRSYIKLREHGREHNKAVSEAA